MTTKRLYPPPAAERPLAARIAVTHYHDVIGFPPAPSAPVHFKTIDKQLFNYLCLKQEWIFVSEAMYANGSLRYVKDLTWERAQRFVRAVKA